MLSRTIALAALAVALALPAQAQSLVQGRVETGTPSLTTNQYAPLQLDAAGRLKVTGGESTVGTTPNGYEQITTLTASTPLTVPANTVVATVSVEGAGVRMRKDGTPPTATVGMPLPTGAFVRLFGPEIAAARFIQQSAGAIINVEYGR